MSFGKGIEGNRARLRRLKCKFLHIVLKGIRLRSALHIVDPRNIRNTMTLSNRLQKPVSEGADSSEAGNMIEHVSRMIRIGSEPQASPLIKPPRSKPGLCGTSGLTLRNRILEQAANQGAKDRVSS